MDKKETQLATTNVTVGSLTEVKEMIAPDATDSELKLFALHCNKTGLDPFSKQIHFIKRGGKATFQTSIDGYRIIAERSKAYAGNDEYQYDEKFTNGESKYPIWAKATVYKVISGQRYSFSATARWDEYKQEYKGVLGNMWAKFPSVMLGKCAEALALRKAFPNDLSGMYTQEEMPEVETNNVNITDEPENKPEEAEVVTNKHSVFAASKYFAVANKYGIDSETAKSKIKKYYKVTSFKEITDEQLQTFSKSIENKFKSTEVKPEEVPL